ncbi:C6 zinc finger domain-containing protein [Trichoderma harzianum]|uniref:C6 zinc finger domain-containing protein n=1 Tax=Trichoderma harzianum TaxID=5544 RepID=A0A0F9XRM1_TRIHA|nr:C6 zinc finger domain-containing protein [Trichoderma harzianum]
MAWEATNEIAWEAASRISMAPSTVLRFGDLIGTEGYHPNSGTAHRIEAWLEGVDELGLITTSKQLGPPSTAYNPELYEYRRQRAGTPKSRFGCLTCKARRVKCDERKPICARCEKARIVCNGYIQPEPRRSMEATSSPLHPLLPRVSTVNKPSERILSQLPRSFSGLPTVCGKHASYFDIFRHHVAPDLSRYQYADLWSSVISEGLQDGFVRELILAIGALARAMASNPSTQRRGSAAQHRLSILASWSNRNITNHHHRASILHHLRAVSSFQSSIKNRDAHFRPRKVFMMTLLLVVYEILQGNLSAADSLLSYGLGMFRYSTTLFQDNAMTSAEIIDVEHILPCVAVMGMFTHQLNSSWTHILQLRAEPEFKIPEFGIDTIAKKFLYLRGGVSARKLLIVPKSMEVSS